MRIKPDKYKIIDVARSLVQLKERDEDGDLIAVRYCVGFSVGIRFFQGKLDDIKSNAQELLSAYEADPILDSFDELTIEIQIFEIFQKYKLIDELGQYSKDIFDSFSLDELAQSKKSNGSNWEAAIIFQYVSQNYDGDHELRYIAQLNYLDKIVLDDLKTGFFAGIINWKIKHEATAQWGYVQQKNLENTRKMSALRKKERKEAQSNLIEELSNRVFEKFPDRRNWDNKSLASEILVLLQEKPDLDQKRLLRGNHGNKALLTEGVLARKIGMLQVI